MKIDFTVTDRAIKATYEGHIPSGGVNDVQCKFTFVDGYGWDEIPNITAIFTRETQWAFQVNITPDEYFYIPASILARQGVVYVSLIGCTNDGVKVVQTTTEVLVVEPNGLNRNTTVIFPVNANNEYDTDAYAQYVAAVNAAAVRAEEAARKLETYVTGSYTKEECDDKFMKKICLSNYITANDYQPKFAMIGSIPSLRKHGITPIVSGSPSYSDPGTIKGVSTLVVAYIGETTLNTTFSGFGELYQLADNCSDYIDIIGNTVTLHRRSNTLNLDEATVSWISRDILRIDITNENAIDPSNLTKVYTNMGNVFREATTDHIDLFIPINTSLTDCKVVYPMKDEYVTVIQNTGLPTIRNNSDYIKVFMKAGAADPEDADSFSITVEVNMITYVDYYKKDADTFEARLKKLEQDYVAIKALIVEMGQSDALASLLANGVSDE